MVVLRVPPSLKTGGRRRFKPFRPRLPLRLSPSNRFPARYPYLTRPDAAKAKSGGFPPYPKATPKS